MITTAALTLALTMTNPINIATCAVDPVVVQTSGDVTRQEIIGTQIHITFVNRGSKAISSVAFAVDEDGTTNTILDRGTFSPGIAVSHYWRGDRTLQNVSCSVNEVLFADGTSWTNQSGPSGIYGL
ncbi:MAG TPA: hypothetical protein VF741_08450 [Candidatus Aquilonibacter sp.]